MKRVKKAGHYRMKYPMNPLQKLAHKKACKRTAEHIKETLGYRVTIKDINQVLNIMHHYILDTMLHLPGSGGINDPSVVHFLFGYYRVIFPKLFTDMHRNGEFTDQEFEIITKELYKDEFEVYNRLIKQREQWKQQQKK